MSEEALSVFEGTHPKYMKEWFDTLGYDAKFAQQTLNKE